MARPTRTLLRLRRLLATGAAALATALVALATGIGATPADAAGSGDYVKYYVVTASYQGKSENLTEISTRFLGTGSRAAEIFVLNTGSKQPDGGTLTDQAVLHPGWILVLPWDAVGSDVQYGALPAGGTGSGYPGAATSPPTKPTTSPQPSHAAAAPSTRRCSAASASSDQSDWASLRLGAEKAWAHSRGDGQLVAVIDSGVDGSLAQLAGHVSVGADVVAGTGRGDTDCLGTGTAMAGIIAAQPAQGSSLTGIAPDATVMPVRVVATTPDAQPDDQATAIMAAVSAGANVIALGSYIDASNSKVAAAIFTATSHDVVVVAGARTTDKPENADTGANAALLRVSGVGVNGQLAAKYVPGAVDVVAPGLNVATLGVNGSGTVSGTQYAVAFAAGEAALVRAAYPTLNAAQVSQQIEATADRLSDTRPDGRYGYGMINPAASVEQAVPAGQQDSAQSSGLDSAGRRVLVSAIAGLLGLVGLVLSMFRIRELPHIRKNASPALATEVEPAGQVD